MHPPSGPAFERYMKDYIRQHFGELLGEHACVLDEEDGIERLAQLVRSGRVGIPYPR